MTLTQELRRPESYPFVDLVTELLELRGEGDWYGFSCVWAEKLTRIPHDDEQRHLTHKSLVTFRAHWTSQDFLPTIYTHIVANYARPSIQDRKMSITYIQYIPYPHIIHSFLVTVSQDLLITTTQIHFHGASNCIPAQHPTEVMQPVRRNAHGAHAVLIHSAIEHRCRHEASKFTATCRVQMVAVRIV
jgi:hypothetical protein